MESTLAAPQFALPQNAFVSNKFRFWLDEPASWEAETRRVRLSGWCVARKGDALRKIRARIGRQTVERTFDRERPDVAEYLNEPNVPRWCGFTLEVIVPPGKHRLVLEAASGANDWRQVFSGDVFGPERDAQEDRSSFEADRFDVWFDHPSDWRAPAKTLYITGWCVDRAGMQVLAIRARAGHVSSPGNYGLFREDVGAKYPFNEHAFHSGFAVAAELTGGKSDLTLEIQTADQQWHTITQRAVFGDPEAGSSPPIDADVFQPNAALRSRFSFWVDPPDDWLKPRRYVHVSGWCFAMLGEPVTEVRARVGRKVFGAYYGIPRPDVAAAYERRPGSLRNGFAVDLVVPWGSQMLVLEARSRHGEWERFFEQRVRGPLAWHHEDTESEIGNYPAWIRQYDTLTRAGRNWVRGDIERFAHRPLISILMPIYNPDFAFLRRAMASVRAQLYPNWQLCIVDDASTDNRVWYEIERSARRDKRIVARRHKSNQHISATSNDALALATGEFVALLDQDDELAETALYFAARELNRDPHLGLIYTDEDKLDTHGRRCDPHFKPEWNPDLFTSQNYISHLTFYAVGLVRSVGGFRRGFEGAQDYDLTWRCIEKISEREIRHIPHVLYHWRAAVGSAAGSAQAKGYAVGAARRAVQEHFDRARVAAKAEAAREIYHRARYSLPADPPLASIIIPTRDRPELLQRSIDSIFDKTDYPRFELVVIDNESGEPATREYLASLAGRVRVLESGGEFNFSKLNNSGVSQACGDVIALVNNDIEVINRGWLTEMVSHALRPEIGAVGAQLRYPNGTIQHAGVILGAGGIGNHAHIGIRDEPGYFSRPHLIQNFSAVTAACMVLRKSVYDQVGGLDETNLAVAFNDVDLCLRIIEAGYRIVYTPYAELIHYESSSRGFEDTHEKRARFLAENEFMHAKWRDKIESDPAYNPNLSLGAKLFALASPPRVRKPWQVSIDGS